MFLGIITLCLTIIVLFFTFFSLRGTILDIRFPAQNPWPLFWYLELALILVPLNLISFLGLDNVQAIFVKDESVILSVNLWTLSSLLILSITLAFLMQLLGLKLDVIRIPKEFSNSLIKKLNIFSLSLTLFGIMLLLAFYNLGYKHAFLSALIEGKSLLHVRLFNKYFSKVPSQLASLLPLIGYLLAATSGYLSRIKFTKGLIYFLVALIFLSADGGKAPIVRGILVWCCSKSFLLPQRLFSFKFVKFFLLVFFSLAVLYYVASLQIPNLNLELYLKYLFNRAGVGQMAGTFETFALAKTGSLPQGEFYWHIIPGARLFVNYIDFQKALMMSVEGYDYTSMGVKNTYFIAEAYAMGGPILAILSPFIVALSLSVSLFLLTKIFEKFFSRPIGVSLAFVCWSQCFSPTGGFSSFPFFKGLVLVLIHLAIIFVWYIFFRGIYLLSLPRDIAIEKR